MRTDISSPLLILYTKLASVIPDSPPPGLLVLIVASTVLASIERVVGKFVTSDMYTFGPGYISTATAKSQVNPVLIHQPESSVPPTINLPFS